MQDMVRIVVPLRIEVAPQVIGHVAIVLQDEMHLATGLRRAAHFGRHLVQPVGLRDGMHGIEAQPVETVFVQPVERVLGKVPAHLGAAKVDRRAPRGRDIVAEELRRVGGEIVPVGTEMVVDDIEEHHQPQPVG